MMNPNDYIKDPCHEDWGKMTGDEKRKFCDKCSTHVHDLTDLNHEEILALKVQNGGKLCGSFRHTEVAPVTSLKKSIGIGAAVAALGVSPLAAASAAS